MTMFDGSSVEAGRIIAFVVAVVVAQLIAMTLFHLSQQQAQISGPRKPDNEAAASANGGSEALVPKMLREMEALALPVAQRRRVATVLSSFVTKEVEARVREAAQELRKEFEQETQKTAGEVITIRQQYQETLAQKERTEAVVRSMAEGLVVVNDKGEVVFLNPAAEKLLGVNQKDKIGKSLSDDLSDEQLVSLVKGQPGRDDLEVELSAKQDQTKRVVRSSNAVIQDENGKTVGMVSVLTDVTKQRELDRMKTDFVSGVTHELRTPIVAIQHSLGVVLNQATGELSDPQRNFLGIAQRNLERLSGMINELLDLAKLEARKVELKPQRVPIQQVVQRVHESLEAWAGSKGIRLERRLPEQALELTCDPGRIEQVLTNLVGNAIKFTPKGGTVMMEATPRGSPGGVEVAVQDTGVGIAKDDIPKLFKKFQQVGNHTPSTIQGTGLGLAIAREIVELHGGRIWVESEKGQGARFIFALPSAPPSQTDT